MIAAAPRSLLLSALLILLAPASSFAQVCVGDCDGSRDVKLGEVQQAFNVFLELAAPNECSAADEDRNGQVSLGEVQLAFNRFLGTCDAPDDLDEVRASSTTALSSIYGVVSFGSLGSLGGGGGGASSPAGIAAAGHGAGSPSDCFTGPCGIAGFVECTCQSDDFFSSFAIQYTNCTFGDSLGNQYVRNGFHSVDIESPDFCFGTSAFGVGFFEEFDGFQSSVQDVSQNFQFVEADYTENFLPNEFGCFPEFLDPLSLAASGHGERTLDGTIRSVQGSGDFLSLDVTETASELTLDVTLLDDQNDCRVEATIDGTLDIVDAVAGTSFSQSFNGLDVDETRDFDGTYLIDIDGGVTTDCLGPVGLFTTESLRLGFDGTCPTDGRLEIELENDGTVAAVEFDANGGVSFDVGADGSIEDQSGSCVDLDVQQCGLERPTGLCAPCSGGDCDGGLACEPCFFCFEGFDMRCSVPEEFDSCNGDVY